LELVKKYIEGQQRGEESLQVPLVSEHKAQIREEDQHLHSQVLQDVLLRLDKAFKAFFRRVKKGENPGYPPLQGRNRYARFTYAQGGYWVDVHEKRAPLTLCKIGTLTITLHRKIEGALKTCTVKHEAGHWYAVFSCEVEESEPLERVESEIGIDPGITHFAALSDGTFIESPRQYRKAQANLKRKQRALSRKKRGSHRRQKAVSQVAKAHRKMANQRRDFPNGAAAKGGLNKSLLDNGLGQFVQIVVSKAEEAGRQVYTVNPEQTSQICSACGIKGPHKDRSERVHICPSCGVVLDRDENAAHTIYLAWKEPTYWASLCRGRD
jgi:putative transposase